MDNSIIIIALLTIIVLALLAFIGFFAYLVFKRDFQNEEEKDGDITNKISQMLEKNKTKERILGLCSICEKELVENDYFNVESLHLCREHFDTYSASDWIPITNERTTSETPEKGVYIYNFKKKVWKDDKIPTFILCEYKIDVTNDLIETYVQLYVQKERELDLRERLQLEK
ncbi:hypothetical protein BALOs_0102 [Halobacteriovorax sp. BALOs_7]|uniref:Uncharacterized protein n=1 Tax=Halobacteriovorax vibrionivorans TaxID=2152716 RepID=A0ABY0IJJ5_9BACT|nr:MULTISPECIES: hypothetical protein [Halobacteriovorax]AYF43123.1 hypothetical protein BALOs_0102 [Halobacteriovorax sp. BALOs_7]RZF23144.1 hypothetical protein DAY19_05085 [Halobacteriovorax vibrionivorans]TGD45948.1 hypothetical protein EP118_14155 [Halobacteriovorax sp. Y22]